MSFTSFAKYKQELRTSIQFGRNDDDPQPLTTQQLKRPMMLIVGLWTMGTIVFIAEYSIHKWNSWRNSRVKYFHMNRSYFGIIQSYSRRLLSNLNEVLEKLACDCTFFTRLLRRKWLKWKVLIYLLFQYFYFKLYTKNKMVCSAVCNFHIDWECCS